MEPAKVVELDPKARRLVRIIDDPVEVHIAWSRGLKVVACIDPCIETQTVAGLPAVDIFARHAGETIAQGYCDTLVSET